MASSWRRATTRSPSVCGCGARRAWSWLRWCSRCGRLYAADLLQALKALRQPAAPAPSPESPALTRSRCASWRRCTTWPGTRARPAWPLSAAARGSTCGLQMAHPAYSSHCRTSRLLRFPGTPQAPRWCSQTACLAHSAALTLPDALHVSASPHACGSGAGSTCEGAVCHKAGWLTQQTIKCHWMCTEHDPLSQKVVRSVRILCSWDLQECVCGG